MSKRVTVIVEGREYIVEVGDLRESPITATVNQRTYRVETPRLGVRPAEQATRPAAPDQVAEEAAASAPTASTSAITAPMPGSIVEVKVTAGDKVQPGDVICVLDAMKMNNLIYADRAGEIASVDVVAGQDVDYGAVLVTFQ
jgi:biotin carboxyl carrier protein